MSIHVDPDTGLKVFNTRAANEIRERTVDLPGLHVRTLNALGLAILDGVPPFAPSPYGARRRDRDPGLVPGDRRDPGARQRPPVDHDAQSSHAPPLGVRCGKSFAVPAWPVQSADQAGYVIPGRAYYLPRD